MTAAATTLALIARIHELEAGLELLADDLAKAEPHHFSIGLMRGRVKDLRAAPKGDDS